MPLKPLKGNKHKDDVIYAFINDKGEVYIPTYEDIGVLVLQIMRNEEILYPPSKGFKGGKMVKEFLDDVILWNQIPIPDFILERYKLKRK